MPANTCYICGESIEPDDTNFYDFEDFSFPMCDDCTDGVMAGSFWFAKVGVAEPPLFNFNRPTQP